MMDDGSQWCPLFFPTLRAGTLIVELARKRIECPFFVMQFQIDMQPPLPSAQRPKGARGPQPNRLHSISWSSSSDEISISIFTNLYLLRHPNFVPRRDETPCSPQPFHMASNDSVIIQLSEEPQALKSENWSQMKWEKHPRCRGRHRPSCKGSFYPVSKR